MTSCQPDLLPEYALGGLAAGEHAAVKAHVQHCSSCAAEVTEMHSALGELAGAQEPFTPPAALRERLMTSVQGERFAGFAKTFAGLFDVATDQAKKLLDLIDVATSWEAGPCEGSALVHFEAGPATAGADTGFVRVAPGVLFPWHKHGGQETNLVLQGSCVDSNGKVYTRGDVFVNEAGTQHEFRAGEGKVDYIFAVIVFDVDFAAEKPAGAPSA